MIHQDLDACAQEVQDHSHKRADGIVAEDGQEQAEDADGEVVHQHLKAGLDLAVNGLVKHLDDPACKGAHDHGAHQHRIIGGAADDAYSCDGAHDSAAGTADHFAALVGDQDRQHVGQHRADHGAQSFIGKPACCDEQRCQQAPGDEGADVRHDHSAEEPAERLDFLFHVFSSSRISRHSFFFSLFNQDSLTITVSSASAGQ